MKLNLIVSAFLMMGCLSAQAGGSVTYDDGGTPPPTVEDQVVFPGNVRVDANLTCLAGNELKATIPAHNQDVCDKMGYQNNNSGYPVWTCVASHTVVIPAQNLVAGLTYQEQDCVKYTYQQNQNGYYVPVCQQYGMVTKNQPLSYRETVYPTDDYRRENGYSTHGQIQNCQ